MVGLRSTSQALDGAYRPGRISTAINILLLTDTARSLVSNRQKKNPATGWASGFCDVRIREAIAY